SSRRGSSVPPWPGIPCTMPLPRPGKPQKPSSDMMHLKSEEIEVLRDCPAVTIPYGSPVTIEKGCTAVITQQLGSSITVMVQGNLYRVEGQDADALGLDVIEVEQHVPEGPVTEEYVKERAWEVLSTCFDPEIPVDIVNLGLVYGCDVIP